MTKWYCPICNEYRNKKIIQCCCGTWQSNQVKIDYIKNNNAQRVFSAINTLNKNNISPKSLLDDPDMFDKYIELLDSIDLKRGENIINIEEAGKMIVNYLGCNSDNIVFKINIIEDDNKTAGYYDRKSKGERRNIVLNLKKHYEESTISYILAHECVHYFLDEMDIREKDILRNEVLTDVATLYLGFIISMHMGKESVKHNFYDTIITRFGYLNDNEIRIVKEYRKRRIAQIHNYKGIRVLRILRLIELLDEYINNVFALEQNNNDSRIQSEIYSIYKKNYELNNSINEYKSSSDALNDNRGTIDEYCEKGELIINAKEGIISELCTVLCREKPKLILDSVDYDIDNNGFLEI